MTIFDGQSQVILTVLDCVVRQAGDNELDQELNHDDLVELHLLKCQEVDAGGDEDEYTLVDNHLVVELLSFVEVPDHDEVHRVVKIWHDAAANQEEYKDLLDSVVL